MLSSVMLLGLLNQKIAIILRKRNESFVWLWKELFYFNPLAE